MAYRPDWFPTKSILNIALDIHMYNKGSLELTNEELILNYRSLAYVLANWNDSFDHFDNAVLNLLQIVIKEER